MTKKLILGLGPGRSGTMSLAKFLDSQKRSYFAHEGAFTMPKLFKYTTGAYLPWEVDIAKYEVWYSGLFSKSADALYFGDVGVSILPHVPLILEKHPDAIFICMTRNKEDVVKSFLRVTAGVNHWNSCHKILSDLNIWYAMFPKIKESSKEESIRIYVDRYYQQAEKFEQEYPTSFKIFDIHDLNSREGRLAIVSFAQIETTDHVIDAEFHSNRSMNPVFHFVLQIFLMVYVMTKKLKLFITSRT